MFPAPTGGKKPGLSGAWGRGGTICLRGRLGRGGACSLLLPTPGLCWAGGSGAVRVPSDTMLFTGGGELRAKVH